MPKLAYDSDLVRKQWMMEGLVQARSMSFWQAYTGSKPDSVVFQTNDPSAKHGHTVVFDYDGNLSGRAIEGKEKAYGKGEQKKKFSTSITVKRYRIPVDNGDEFDGVEVGDLEITQHGDSRTKLADLFVRWKDQAIFDAAQGHLGQAPTHIIDTGTTFTFNTIIDIESKIKVSRDFDTGSDRRPLEYFKMTNGKAIWLMVIDTEMAAKLRKDTAGYQNIIAGGDVRGAENRNIKGYIGKLGSLEIVEADLFFGDTENMTYNGNNVTFKLKDSEVEVCGLRQRDGNGKWTGDATFDSSTANRYSRGLVLGRNAIQMAFGRQPDYKHQYSDDFKITSESAVEFWMNVQKTRLLAETDDYDDAKVAGIDYGVIAVETQVKGS